jgi:CrcB protein
MSTWVQGRLGLEFPWGTLSVNLVGCLLIGVAYGAFEAVALPDPLRHFVTLGVLGAFTTFSTFSYETVALVQQGQGVRALAYVVGSVAAGFALVLAGLEVGRGVAGGG